MPWFPYPRQAADGVLALEACRFVRASSVFDGRCSAEPRSIRTTFSPCSRLGSSPCFACERGASRQGPRFTYGSSRYVHRLGYPLLTPSTVAPKSLFERLRSSRGSQIGRVSVGSRERPPRWWPPNPWRSFLLLRGYVAFFDGSALDFPFLRKLSAMEEGLRVSIGCFRVGVVTYSRWSERHLPQIELLSDNPSENLCPV